MPGCPFLPVCAAVPSGRLGTRSTAFRRWLPGAAAARREAMCSGAAACRGTQPPQELTRGGFASDPTRSSIKRMRTRSCRGCSDGVSGARGRDRAGAGDPRGSHGPVTPEGQRCQGLRWPSLLWAVRLEPRTSALPTLNFFFKFFLVSCHCVPLSPPGLAQGPAAAAGGVWEARALRPYQRWRPRSPGVPGGRCRSVPGAAEPGRGARGQRPAVPRAAQGPGPPPPAPGQWRGARAGGAGRAVGRPSAARRSVAAEARAPGGEATVPVPLPAGLRRGRPWSHGHGHSQVTLSPGSTVLRPGGSGERC